MESVKPFDEPLLMGLLVKVAHLEFSKHAYVQQLSPLGG